MTRAIAYTEFGGPEVLHEIEAPDVAPAPGEVAIRVEAAGVNPIDGKLRAGLRRSAAIVEPRRVGSDGAGDLPARVEPLDDLAVGGDRRRKGRPGPGPPGTSIAHRPTMPSTGLLAVAYILRGIRPDR